MDRSILWIALGCYAIASVLTVRRLQGGGGVAALHRLNLGVMLAGFALHTTAMALRGQQLMRCPLTNGFESMVFLTWAALLFYLLIGPSYRLSFLGAFTAPLVLAICLVALLTPIDVPHAKPLNRSAWVEFHAAIAVLAYGAFALSCVVGGMYLVQERQLKTRRLTSAFLLLPPVDQLDGINYRLLLMGFGMLTVGMVGGMISYRIVGHWTTAKIVWAWFIWVMYAGLLTVRMIWSVRGRKLATASMVAFACALISFLLVSALSVTPPTP
jgi:ABC-type transport system involved in cytochrome c biogenesis permease subunit